MNRVNKKGFILIETLVATVFVVTLFVIIYKASVPALGEYEQMVKYDDIDSIYYANLYKQMLTRYGKLENLDELLTENTYVDITNCENNDIYTSSNYCRLIQDVLKIDPNMDKIFITDYNLTNFKQTVKNDVNFDSGTFSNFRNYIKTVSNVESFYYKRKDNNDIAGRYRLFIVRNIKESDGTKGKRYVNLGIYTGAYPKFVMGEIVYFDPDGNGERKFYSLKNSSSTEANMDLILYNNIQDSICFNSTSKDKDPIYGTSIAKGSIPDTVINRLNTLTSNWTNANKYNNYSYTPTSGYTITYNGYSRLLEEEEILELIGCREDESLCFDYNNAFMVTYDANKLHFLADNTTATKGYWTTSSVPNTDLYAWSIRNGEIAPTRLDDCTSNGIRPIVNVKKSKVRRGA